MPVNVILESVKSMKNYGWQECPIIIKILTEDVLLDPVCSDI